MKGGKKMRLKTHRDTKNYVLSSSEVEHSYLNIKSFPELTSPFLIDEVRRVTTTKSIPDDRKTRKSVEICLPQSTMAKQPSVLKDSESSDKQGVYPEPEVLEYMECQARLFEENRKVLLSQYAGMYVIFEDGQVLDADKDEAALVMRSYSKTGPRHLFVKKVIAEEPKLTVRVPSMSY
jgi:hypothetical protein